MIPRLPRDIEDRIGEEVVAQEEVRAKATQSVMHKMLTLEERILNAIKFVGSSDD